MTLFRAADIPQFVKSLSTEQQDVLMKYLYAGMGKPEQYNSSVFLTWHEKVKKNREREREKKARELMVFFFCS